MKRFITFSSELLVADSSEEMRESDCSRALFRCDHFALPIFTSWFDRAEDAALVITTVLRLTDASPPLAAFPISRFWFALEPSTAALV